MKHTILYTNNRKISLYLWENQNFSKPTAIVHIIHGFFDHASRYDEFAQFLVRHGIVVVSHDLNGHGYTTPIDNGSDVNPSSSATSSYSSHNPNPEPSFDNNEGRPSSQNYYPRNYTLKERNDSAKIPKDILDVNENNLPNHNPTNEPLSSTKEEQIYASDSDSNSEKMPKPIPAPSYQYPSDPVVNTMPIYSTPQSNLDYKNNNLKASNGYSNLENDLPPYSSSLNKLGFEKGNMFQKDIADILAVSSYCRERYVHVPLILLGVGYGSFLAQYFIEHNKYKLNWNGRETATKTDHLHQHQDRHHNHHQRKSSKQDKKKSKNKAYRENDDTLIQRHSLNDSTIDGFILCGTNYMKGLLFRTNKFYADFLYYIKGKDYRTNFLFPSIFEAYKFQMENDHLNSDSDSSSSSSSNSNSHTGSYIDSPDTPDDKITSRERISVPRITFAPSEIEKYKPMNQWFTRNYYELTKVQQDPLCNFPYSINFYRSLLHEANKLYKHSHAKGINTKIPILILAGDHDPLGNYSKGPVRLYNFYKDYNVHNVKLFIYENARHSVLFENNKIEIYHDILKWANDYVLTSN